MNYLSLMIRNLFSSVVIGKGTDFFEKRNYKLCFW